MLAILKNPGIAVILAEARTPEVFPIGRVPFNSSMSLILSTLNFPVTVKFPVFRVPVKDASPSELIKKFFDTIDPFARSNFVPSDEKPSSGLFKAKL